MDGPVTARGWRVAALARVDLHVHGDTKAVIGWGRKTPEAILLAGPSGVFALDCAGQGMDRAQIDALLPGAWDRFAAGSQATAT